MYTSILCVCVSLHVELPTPGRTGRIFSRLGTRGQTDPAGGSAQPDACHVASSLEGFLTGQSH